MFLLRILKDNYYEILVSLQNEANSEHALTFKYVYMKKNEVNFNGYIFWFKIVND